MTSWRLAEAANIRALRPRTFSTALTSTPASRSAVTVSALPDAAATISGVVPVAVACFGSAPAFTSTGITAAFPWRAARNSGV